MKNQKKEITKFVSRGFVVLKIFNANDILKIKNKIFLQIKKKLPTINHKKIDSHFLKKYHKHVITDKEHQKIINQSMRFINIDQKLISKIKKNKKLENILLNYWGHKKFIIKWIGSLKKKEIKNNSSGFRITRPHNRYCINSDAAGEHCDLHVGGVVSNDEKILITLWTPIIGFSSVYTLRIAPGSHKFNHPFDRIIKQKKSISRVLKKTYLKKFKFLRLNLKFGEAICFHPNLIHGGSINLGNSTRISTEIRLFNSQRIKFFPNSLKPTL